MATSLAYIIESTRSDGEPFLAPREVVGPATVALLALLSDLCHYYVASRQSLALLRQIERQGVDVLPYPRNALYFARSVFFYLKVGICFVSALWLVAVTGVRALELI